MLLSWSFSERTWCNAPCWHPHRGIETVACVIDGALERQDNAGCSGMIRASDVQWMTTGRGLLHVEQPPVGVTTHSLQLWVNLPASDKLAEPRYQDLVATELPVRREPGATARVYCGTSSQVAASAKNHVPVTMAEFRLDRPFVMNTEQQVREAYSDYQRAASAPRKP